MREWAEDDLRANGLAAVLQVGVAIDDRWVAIYEIDGGRRMLCDARYVGGAYGMGTVEFTQWTAVSSPVGSAAGGVLPEGAMQVTVAVPDADVHVRVARGHWAAAVAHRRPFTQSTITAQPVDGDGKGVGPPLERTLFRPRRGPDS